jgi:multiple sugar transport system substrate-binding protein
VRASKFALLPLALTAALATATAAGPGMAAARTSLASKSQTSTVTIALPYASFFDPPVKVAAAQCAKEGVTIKYTNVNADYNDFNLKMEVEAQSGTAPDLAVQGLDTVGFMGQSSYFTNLAPLTSGESEFSAKSMPLLEAGKASGKLVAIPWGVSLPVVWINKSLFKAAGVSATTPIKSWAQLASLAKKLTDQSKKQYGLAIGDSEGWIALNFLLAGGSNIVTSSGKVSFDNPAGVKVSQFLNGLFNNGSAFPGTETEGTQQFEAGHVAMWIATTSELPDVAKNAKFGWSAVPFPADAGKPVKLAAGGVGISMLAPQSDRAASLKAIGCLFGTPELKSVVGLGYLPVSGAHSSAFASIVTKTPFAQALTQYGDVGPWFNFPGQNGSEGNTTFDNAWNNAEQQHGNPAPTLSKAASQVNQILG